MLGFFSKRESVELSSLKCGWCKKAVEMSAFSARRAFLCEGCFLHAKLSVEPSKGGLWEKMFSDFPEAQAWVRWQRTNGYRPHDTIHAAHEAFSESLALQKAAVLALREGRHAARVELEAMAELLHKRGRELTESTQLLVQAEEGREPVVDTALLMRAEESR